MVFVIEFVRIFFKKFYSLYPPCKLANSYSPEQRNDASIAVFFSLRMGSKK